MHILFLTDNFPPEVNAPASRTYEHAREWVRQGHTVTVVTCTPNFPKGRPFAGYRNALRQVETIDGIRVVRMWTYMSANEGTLRRILDYLSFMVMGSIGALFVERPSLVIGTSPQFFTGCAARFVALCKKVPWVFEVRDLWPESIKAVGAMKDSALIRALEWVEMRLYGAATRVIVVTEASRRTLLARGVLPGKVEVVTNGVDLSSFRPQPREEGLAKELGLESCFVAGYIGTHGLAHALDTLLDAARLLQNRPEAARIRILFLGDGAEKARLVQSAIRAGLRNVVFVDSVPKSRVAAYWSLLDVALIHLRGSELFSTVIPSKLFECMGMGIPVLHGVTGESAEIVVREDVGELFEPENAHQLADRLVALSTQPETLERYRRNGPRAAEKYDRRQLAMRMLSLLPQQEKQ